MPKEVKKAGNVYIDNFLTNFNSSSKATLEKIGNDTISQIQVQRYPIPSIIETVGNFVSNNSVDELKKKYNYTDLFHLRMVCNINNHLYVVEKNEDVNISNVYTQKKNTEVMDVRVTHPVTLNEMIEKCIASIGEKHFHLYSSTSTNCQHFVASMLSNSNLLTAHESEFIHQNVGELVPKLPYLAHLFMNAVTTAKAIYNRIGGDEELDNMKYGELRELAQHMNIGGSNKMKKLELKNAIKYGGMKENLGYIPIKQHKDDAKFQLTPAPATIWHGCRVHSENVKALYAPYSKAFVYPANSSWSTVPLWLYQGYNMADDKQVVLAIGRTNIVATERIQEESESKFNVSGKLNSGMPLTVQLHRGKGVIQFRIIKFAPQIENPNFWFSMSVIICVCPPVGIP